MSLNDLYSLSASEKLRLIEQLWDSLDENDVLSPNWHKEILQDRKKRYDNNELELIPLKDFKRKQK
jgi:putative addiction module component (TIGR02574 family)